MLIKKLRVIFKKVNGLVNKEDGFVLVFVAAGMLAFLGITALVVDVGTLALEKRRLQNACDAAALAAAQELYYTGDESQAHQKARQYLENNNVMETPAVAVDNQTRTVTVSSSRTREMAFIRVAGINTGTVSARAKAVFGAVTKIDGSRCAVSPLVPFGVPDCAAGFIPGEEVVLKYSAGIPQIHGNFGGLALGGRGANNYGNNIKYGYQGTLGIGSRVLTEPGNMSGKTKSGLQYRLEQCPHTPPCTYDGGYDPDCPRVIIVPVYKPQDLYGRDEVEIVRFAVMLLEKATGSGNQCSVYGRFISMAPPSGTKIVIDPYLPAPSTGPNEGLYAARLLE